MIEEAAGTRLYETKKEAAQKTIEKKDAKLREIDTVNISKLCTSNISSKVNYCSTFVDYFLTWHTTPYLLVLSLSRASSCK